MNVPLRIGRIWPGLRVPTGLIRAGLSNIPLSPMSVERDEAIAPLSPGAASGPFGEVYSYTSTAVPIGVISANSLAANIGMRMQP